MKVKREKCKYCGREMNPKTTRAEFCSPKCRVYWNRENIEQVVAENNEPKNKKRIEVERNTPITVVATNPLPTDECIPTNLAELKAMCPYTNKDEMRVWVATERQKYGI